MHRAHRRIDAALSATLDFGSVGRRSFLQHSGTCYSHQAQSEKVAGAACTEETCLHSSSRRLGRTGTADTGTEPLHPALCAAGFGTGHASQSIGSCDSRLARRTRCGPGYFPTAAVATGIFVGNSGVTPTAPSGRPSRRLRACSAGRRGKVLPRGKKVFAESGEGLFALGRTDLGGAGL